MKTLKSDVVLVNDVEHIVNEICREYGSEKLQPEIFGQKIELLRETLGLKIDDFSERCGISAATYHRWVQGKSGLPPRHRVAQLKVFLENYNWGKKPENAHCYGSIKPHIEYVDRQVLCKRQWSLKSLLPYRAAKHPVIKKRITDLLLNDKDADFNCIFYAEKEDAKARVSQWSAMNSFGQYKQMLCKQDPTAIERFKGWLVDDRDLALEIGLSNLALGLSILEYDQIKKKAHSSEMDEREVDYFYEIPMAIYPASIENQTSGDEEIRWIEWSPYRASQDWASRKQLFEQITGSEPPFGVRQFLATKRELDSFRPKDYPN